MPALNTIIDVAIALIIILFVVHGARRGFVLTVTSFVTVVIALVGSLIVTWLLADKVADSLIAPLVGDRIEQVLNSPGKLNLKELEELSVMGVRLGDLPVFATLDESAAVAAAQLSSALSLVIAKCFIGIVSFIVIIIVLKIIAHALDLVARLPVLNSLNGLLGAVMGLATGVLWVMLIVTVLSLFTGVIPPEVADNTILFKLVRDIDPLSFVGQGGVQA